MQGTDIVLLRISFIILALLPLLPLSRHEWSAATISAYLRRGPRG